MQGFCSASEWTQHRAKTAFSGFAFLLPGCQTIVVLRAPVVWCTGKGPVHGTKVHTEFGKQVKKTLGLPTEVSYQDGEVVERGTKGSIRVDVVLGDLEKPTAIFDLKTGNAKLTEKRIEQIRKHLPEGFEGIPIIEIRNQ